jgi:hypothetical protein
MQGFFNEVAFDPIRADGHILPGLVNVVEGREPSGCLLIYQPVLTKLTAERMKRHQGLVGSHDGCPRVRTRRGSTKQESSHVVEINERSLD